MKILHLWRSDSPQQGGGGAISMNRIHRNLKKHGIGSHILCESAGEGAHTDTSLIPPLGAVERRVRGLTARIGLNDVHRLSSFRLTRLPEYREADIVHFHGLHSGFVNYLALPMLTREKPAVFTLRDMWAFTGHCAYTRGCERWRSGCGQCPHLDASPAVQRDATRLEWLLKNWSYRHSNLTVVGISRWIRDLAKSSMLSRFPLRYIPNGVDVDEYYPRGRQQARAALGLPHDRLVVMFASVDIDDARKGGDILLAALNRVAPKWRSRMLLLLLGNKGDRLAAACGDIPHVALGEVNDTERKALAYSAADVFAFPSRQDAFGNVALESMACATPVVAFDGGGVAEAVRTGDSGYLAQAEDAVDFARGLEALLVDAAGRHRMGRTARDIVLHEYSAELEVHRYLDLYRRLLSTRALRSTPRTSSAHPKHSRVHRIW